MLGSRTAWLGRIVVGALLLAGCGRKPPVAAPAVASLSEDALLRQVAARATLDPAKARFSVKMASRPLKIAAPPLAGGLIVDRPGRAWITVLNPVGSPVITLASDGGRVAMVNAHDKQFIAADDAGTALIGASGGEVDLDQVVGLMLGLVPIDPQKVERREVVEGGVRFTASGPGGTTIHAVVEEAFATPVYVEVVGTDGVPVVTATYEPFTVAADDARVPSRIVVLVPSVELTVDVRFKSWESPTELPDVFHPEAPAGFMVMTFAEYAEAMKAQRAAAEAAP